MFTHTFPTKQNLPRGILGEKKRVCLGSQLGELTHEALKDVDAKRERENDTRGGRRSTFYRSEGERLSQWPTCLPARNDMESERERENLDWRKVRGYDGHAGSKSLLSPDRNSDRFSMAKIYANSE
ncbi:hypothetical protein NPIL_15521 [Nephila pilipes]|uniref:Uncharacterized protein n=1 Tax=Nephila pilipes TaxID=299642 RepID=A0A8X6U840_NEPPI|nr:hypothetical protein NPIL_15521 [Nephila pilipes]